MKSRSCADAENGFKVIEIIYIDPGESVGTSNPWILKKIKLVNKIVHGVSEIYNIFSELLVKIFCNIVDTGFLNTSWAISETKKLQNLEGSIDMITFRLAKTRFWNYISNRTHWTKNNQDLKVHLKLLQFTQKMRIF